MRNANDRYVSAKCENFVCHFKSRPFVDGHVMFLFELQSPQCPINQCKQTTPHPCMHAVAERGQCQKSIPRSHLSTCFTHFPIWVSTTRARSNTLAKFCLLFFVVVVLLFVCVCVCFHRSTPFGGIASHRIVTSHYPWPFLPLPSSHALTCNRSMLLQYAPTTITSTTGTTLSSSKC